MLVPGRLDFAVEKRQSASLFRKDSCAHLQPKDKREIGVRRRTDGVSLALVKRVGVIEGPLDGWTGRDVKTHEGGQRTRTEKMGVPAKRRVQRTRIPETG